MRGRTNITQRALPYVNGDVISGIIENNNTVAVGDFVEYKTASATSVAPFVANSENFNVQLYYGNDYILCIQKDYNSNTYLEMWSKITGLRVHRISIPKSYCNCNILSNGDILLYYQDANSSNQTTDVTIQYISFENNQLIIKDTKVFSYVNDLWNGLENASYAQNRYLTVICEVDTTHFMIISHSYGSAGGSSLPWVYNSFVHCISMDMTNKTIGSIVSRNEITFESGVTYVTNPADSQNNRPVSSKIENKKVFFCIHTFYNKPAYIRSIIFDSNYDFTIEYAASITLGNYGNIKQISKNNFATMAIKSGSQSYGLREIKVLNYDETSNIINIVTVSSPYTNGNGVNSLILGGIEDVFYAYHNYSYGDSGIQRMEFDDDSNTAKYSNTYNTSRPLGIIVSDSVTNIKGYDFPNTSSSSNTTYEYNLLYSPSDNELSAGVDTRYVKQYNGGKAIGFAKTAGNAGDSINIYVPHQS